MNEFLYLLPNFFLDFLTLKYMQLEMIASSTRATTAATTIMIIVRNLSLPLSVKTKNMFTLKNIMGYIYIERATIISSCYETQQIMQVKLQRTALPPDEKKKEKKKKKYLIFKKKIHKGRLVPGGGVSAVRS